MKCISLWQPWASLLVLGTKKIETRSWYSSHRGPLLIHAAKRKVKSELADCFWLFGAALHEIVESESDMFNLPFGAIIGSVEMVDCRRTESFRSVLEPDSIDKRHRIGNESPLPHSSWSERELGDFNYGRFGWVMENPVRFEMPIPYKGQQGLFEVTETELSAVKEMLKI